MLKLFKLACPHPVSLPRFAFLRQTAIKHPAHSFPSLSMTADQPWHFPVLGIGEPPNQGSWQDTKETWEPGSKAIPFLLQEAVQHGLGAHALSGLWLRFYP